MKTRDKSFLLTLILTAGLSGSVVYAEQEVYGSQLMTNQERIEHRTKMQSMKTLEERERYRMEHHKKMMERAKQQGVTLPDMPMPSNRGMGDGPGGGMGGGKGR